LRIFGGTWGPRPNTHVKVLRFASGRRPHALAKTPQSTHANALHCAGNLMHSSKFCGGKLAAGKNFFKNFKNSLDYKVPL
jgi:hypothetical protein